MLKDAHAFSSFSVNNLAEAKEFYGQTLGLETEDAPMGLMLKIAGNNKIFVYEKDNHTPATFTVLNFPVDDIDQAIDKLARKGITFDQYDLGNGAKTDEKGVVRGLSVNKGPDIAWFKDPAGNVISILEGSL